MILEDLPDDLQLKLGTYLNNNYLRNFSLTSKFNNKIQKKNIYYRYKNLFENYNLDKMILKYKCGLDYFNMNIIPLEIKKLTSKLDKFIEDKLYFIPRKSNYNKDYGNILIKIFKLIKYIESPMSPLITNNPQLARPWNVEYIKELFNDLVNIITLIKSGYNGYNNIINDSIIILIPFSKNSKSLQKILKIILKNKILNVNTPLQCVIRDHINYSFETAYQQVDEYNDECYPLLIAIIYSNLEALKILIEYGNAIIYDEGLIEFTKNIDKNIYEYLQVSK